MAVVRDFPGQLPPGAQRVGVPTIYHLSAALDVRGRVSNPRPISLASCNPCPDGLSMGGLAASHDPDPRAHALWLTHHASLPLCQACGAPAAAGAPPPQRAARRASDLRSAVPRCSLPRVRSSVGRPWRASASVWPGGPGEARDRALSARTAVPASEPESRLSVALGLSLRTTRVSCVSVYGRLCVPSCA